MKKNYKLTLFIGLPVVIIAGLVYWLSWSGSTDHIKSVANQFKPDSSWKLVSETIRPPQTLCIGMTCPYLARAWTMEKPIDQAELSKILQDSGWTDVKVEQECVDAKKETGRIHTCSVRGKVDRYSIIIYADDSDSSIYDSPSVVLFME